MGWYAVGLTIRISVTRSTPIGWSNKARLGSFSGSLRFASSFTAKTLGSMKKDGLFVSSRGVNISIADPAGIHVGAIDQVGNGKLVPGPVRWSAMPMGHQPLVRQFIRFLNFSTPRSAPGGTETVRSGHISSISALRNSAASGAWL